MKKHLLIFLSIMLAFPLALSAEEVTFDFANNNMNLPVGTDEDKNVGNLGGKSVTIDGVTLKFVNSMTMPTRYYLNGSRGKQFQAIAGSLMRVTAPTGFSVKTITSVPNEGKNAATGETTIQCNWKLSKGGGSLNANKQVWTGNSESVLLVSTGATYLNAVSVEFAPVDAETKRLADEEADSYTERDGLAAFQQADADEFVKLKLTNAVITSGMINGWGHYVQDATAGAHFYCTGLDFEIGDVLNGVVYVKKNQQKMGARICMTEATNSEGLAITKNGTYEPITGSIGQINVAENYCRIVKLTGVSLVGSSETDATAADASGSIVVKNDKVNYFPYVIKESFTTINFTNATIVGILYGTNSNGNRLMPLSIADNNSSGINVTLMEQGSSVPVSFYNLSGQRVEHPTKGIFIQNGKKIVVK